MAEIELVGLSHRYVETEYALRNINLTWEDGGAYALLGPSGCGKTTMLDIISGLVVPSAGQVLFDGADVSTRSTADRNIAQVFQFPVLYGTMSVEQNLRFPLRNRGIGRRAAQKRAEEIADLLEIGDLLRRRAKDLPADAKQLVSLGRALVRTDVSAILFDEPLTVIDPHKKWNIRQALKRVHAELSHTLVYVTHDQTEALTFADEVVVMSEGQVIQKGTPDELFERPAHQFVGSFIGSPAINLVPVEVADSVVRIGGVALLTLPPVDGDLEAAAQSGDLVAGIRPEMVSCHAEPSPGLLAATVGRRQDLGTAVLVELEIGELVLTAKLPAQAEVGDPCWVALDPDHLLLFHKELAVEGVAPIRHDADDGEREVPGP
jgi:glycerol transport system ATP-binding protein